jgi:hypothetical protein
MTFPDQIRRINLMLDGIGVPHEVNEERIEVFLLALEDTKHRDEEGKLFWLTMARLTELTLLCAGHYADNCEFSAAGDLLVNPREIIIRVRETDATFIKDRHRRLRDQLARMNSKGRDGSSISIEKVNCKISTPSLLPYLKERLSNSGFFQIRYLHEITERMERIADTLGFLSVLRVNSIEELHQRINSAEKGRKDFIQRHLCRFDCRLFYRFGRQITYELAHQDLQDQPSEDPLARADLCTIY